MELFRYVYRINSGYAFINIGSEAISDPDNVNSLCLLDFNTLGYCYLPDRLKFNLETTKTDIASNKEAVGSYGSFHLASTKLGVVFLWMSIRTFRNTHYRRTYDTAHYRQQMTSMPMFQKCSSMYELSMGMNWILWYALQDVYLGLHPFCVENFVVCSTIYVSRLTSINMLHSVSTVISSAKPGPLHRWAEPKSTVFLYTTHSIQKRTSLSNVSYKTPSSKKIKTACYKI